MKHPDQTRPALLLAFLFAPLCATGACNLTPPESPPTRSTTFEGVELRLKETVGGTVISHPSDRQNESRTQLVDVDGKLRLTFAPPPDAPDLAASPEWRALEDALEVFEDMLEDYEEFTQRAQTLPSDTFAGTAAWQSEIRAFRNAQLSEIRSITGRDGSDSVLTPDEFNTAFMSPGADGFPDPYVGIAQAINRKQEELRARVAAYEESSDEYEVTVRATITPQVGKPQQLQIPGYFEIDPDTGSLESSDAKRNARFRKLRAEFAAAEEYAAAVRELQAKKGEIDEVIESLVREAAQKVEDAARALADHAANWPARFETILTAPEVANSDDPDVAQLAEDLARLKGDLELADDVFEQVRRIVDKVDDLDAEGLLALASDSEELRRLEQAAKGLEQLFGAVAGSGDTEGWSDVLPRVLTNAGDLVFEDSQGAAARALADLRSGVLAELKDAQESLEGMLPETTKALRRISDVLDGGRMLLRGVEAFEPATGEPIPHQLGDDLPDAAIDLGRTALTHGDELDLTVRFWPLEDGKRPAEAKPGETVTYSMEAVNEGWVWSGDLIFTRPVDGPADDAFVANAAVSREWRFYDREDPGGSVNWWRPGLGLHAAQLNQDPDTSTEFGIGVNASLWDGLLRVGYGYNISVDDDQEYFFFGLGVIAALDRLSVLNSQKED